MSPIFQALNSGYPPQKILGFLSKAFPQLAPQISKATAAGYSAQKILGFLSKTVRDDIRPGMSETEIHSANKRHDAQLTKNGLMAIGSSVAAPFAAQAVGNAFQRALPASLQSGLGQGFSPISQSIPSGIGQNVSSSAATPTTPQQVNNVQPQQPPVPPVNQAAIPTNIPQAPNISQPINPQRDTKKSLDIIKNLGQEASIKNMLEGGMNPKDIAGVLKTIMPKDKFKALAAQEGGLESVISDFAESLKGQEQIEPAVMTPEEIIEQTSPEAEIEPPKPISKHSLVASPKGVGEVKEIRNGQALIEVQGKLHKVDEDELIQSPMEEKDIADLYDELIQGIQKATGKQVSRNVEWAGYDPKTNELAYKPHGSDKLYAYDEISPEDIELLTSLLTQRKSTGENFIGAWEKGTESPIGAAMYQLIKKLQGERGGKGNEYKNRYETIYDALEPAKKAAKEKHAQAKKKAKKPRIS